jgi:hypothetical protein
MTHRESCDSPPYFQHLPAPTNHLICKAMLINQILVDFILRTNYLTIILTLIGYLLSIYYSFKEFFPPLICLKRRFLMSSSSIFFIRG